MTDQTRTLTPNRDEVVSKVIDGEAIIINLSSGIYYSMDKVAGFVWDLLNRHVPLDRIVNELATRYDVDTETAASDVDKLVAQLEEEMLIVETNAEPDTQVPDTTNGTRMEYVTPVLNIYRDMGDLLALDPPQPGLEDTPWRADESASEA